MRSGSSTLLPALVEVLGRVVVERGVGGLDVLGDLVGG